MKKYLKYIAVIFIAAAVVLMVEIKHTPALRAAEDTEVEYVPAAEPAAPPVEVIEVSVPEPAAAEPVTPAQETEISAEETADPGNETADPAADAVTETVPEDDAAKSETAAESTELEADENTEAEEAEETEEAEENEEDKKDRDRNYSVYITCNVGPDSKIREGDLLVLTACISGFEGQNVEYQWLVLENGIWVPIAGETGASYSFAASAETMSRTYDVVVTVVP